MTFVSLTYKLVRDEAFLRPGLIRFSKIRLWFQGGWRLNSMSIFYVTVKYTCTEKFKNILLPCQCLQITSYNTERIFDAFAAKFCNIKMASTKQHRSLNFTLEDFTVGENLLHINARSFVFANNLTKGRNCLQTYSIYSAKQIFFAQEFMW